MQDSMIDLGCVPKTDNGPDSPVSPTPASKEPVYPELRASDEAWAKLQEAVGGKITVGESFTATVELQISGVSDTKYDKSGTFKVLSIGDIEQGTGNDSDETDEPDETDDGDGGDENPAVSQLKAKAAAQD